MLVGDSQFVDDLSEKLGLKPRPSAGVHFHECEHQKPSPTFVEIILNMHIIWKRPDGFENAQPSDFFKISLSNGAQLWLHH